MFWSDCTNHWGEYVRAASSNLRTTVKVALRADSVLPALSTEYHSTVCSPSAEQAAVPDCVHAPSVEAPDGCSDAASRVACREGDVSRVDVAWLHTRPWSVGPGPPCEGCRRHRAHLRRSSCRSTRSLVALGYDLEGVVPRGQNTRAPHDLLVGVRGAVLVDFDDLGSRRDRPRQERSRMPSVRSTRSWCR